MDAEWITSPTARRILLHWADPRPAWLWSQDGATLLWHNAAARMLGAKLKPDGLKLLGEAVPIRGQVTRLIRLGSPGRGSLSRVQLLAGGRPLSETCACTPLAMPDGALALLLVGVERIDPKIIDAAGGLAADAMTEALFPAGLSYRLVEPGAPIEPGATRIEASPEGAALVLSSTDGAPAATIDAIRSDEGDSEDDLANMEEPMLPMGLEPIAETSAPAWVAADQWVEPIPPAPNDRALSSLFDRLADDAGLYTTLTAADEVFVAPATVAEAASVEPESAPGSETEAPVEPEIAPLSEKPAAEADPAQPDMIASLIEYADDPEEAAAPELLPPQAVSHWMITGRGFRRFEPEPATASEPVAIAEPEETEPEPPAAIDAISDPETAERVSRYNFEELGRILTDRVSAEPSRPDAPLLTAPRPASGEGVVNLSAETLVLNRLPLAILVFRDQLVLFANRALTDLLGYDTVDRLRAAGIGAIFPAADGTAAAGPVNRLIRQDGAPLPVSARLQSVSWQGRPALMLSASPQEPFRGHEGAVRAFAEIAAEAREDGFVIADRAGIVTQLSAHGSVLLGQPAPDIIGKPLAILVSKPDMEPLRAFLEKPARFAETTRPSLVARSEDGNSELVLFAEGQAGVVTGYFGFLRKRASVVAPVVADEALEPSMLGRLSRGIRRPLNTIIGFADLLRGAPSGIPPDRERAAEYATDIRTAGLEIAALVDELEDFTRLRDGRYAPSPADVDLQLLLESCITRVKAQAGEARVLVRSAISSRLPRIHADTASLQQALLNLLASAIDQTPVGGSVILSAQSEDDGSIGIHVRDGAETRPDLGDRFVVFRDGVDRAGEKLGPVRSSVGLALTRSLLAVNACSLSVDPTAGIGTLFSLLIPADLIVKD